MKNKLLVTLLILSLTFAAFGQAEPAIPIIVTSGKVASFRYKVEEDTSISVAARKRLLEEKTKQYDQLLKDGKSTREAADGVLASIRNLPLSSSRSYSVQFTFRPTSVLVSADWTEKGSIRKAWTLLGTNFTLKRGWSGGDYVELTSGSAPYAGSNAMLPILPIQLPGVKTFVDLLTTGGSIRAQMMTVSTNTDRYLEGTLDFRDGRLVSASVDGVESWSYADYVDKPFPIPSRIRLERDFDQDKKPQVTKQFELVKSEPDLRTVEKLLLEAGGTIVDTRTDPQKQFVYEEGKGSLLEQAVKGRAYVGNRSRPGGLPLSGLPLEVVLIGSSLVLLIGVSAFQLLKRRKNAK